HPNDTVGPHQLAQKPKSLRQKGSFQPGHAREIAARAIEPRHQPGPDRVIADVEHNGNCCRRRLCCKRRWQGGGDDHSYPPAHQIDGHRRQLIIALCCPNLDRNGFAVSVARIGQSLAEVAQIVRIERGRAGENPDHRHRRLLGTRRNWPCRRRAAYHPDEIAPPHCLSEARTSNRTDLLQRQCIKSPLSIKPMSALGQKRTYALQKAMSALPPKAGICGALAHVRLGPKADIEWLHSIISSAPASSAGGTVSPSAFAVL